MLAVISTAILMSISFIAYASKISHEENSAVSAADAKALFDSKCAKCHGKDGRAKSLHARHEHARDLTSADWQNDVTDERIYNSISNGKGKMPSFKQKLSDDQINSLVSYVRQFRR
jgi:mono/diheme cytochrome c family protein